MSTTCHDCPHRKRSEGGACADGEAVEAMGRFALVAHPCHNAPTANCRGHVRDLAMVAAGKWRLGEDKVGSTYELKMADGTLLHKGEYTAEEIREFKLECGSSWWQPPEDAAGCRAELEAIRNRLDQWTGLELAMWKARMQVLELFLNTSEESHDRG